MNKFDEKRKKKHDRECLANEMTYAYGLLCSMSVEQFWFMNNQNKSNASANGKCYQRFVKT